MDSWLYGNPETVLIRKQEAAAKKERACGDCTHHKSIEFKGEVYHLCELKKRVYGKRCDLFTTGKQ